jgi:hypothetical protein
MTIAVAVLTPLAVTVALFALYLSYCTLRVARDNGKLAEAPKLVQIVCWTILGTAITLDVLFNFLFGTIIFVESPELRRPTFTQRCKKHMRDDGWRGDIARWVCDSWLNPFEAGHC